MTQNEEETNLPEVAEVKTKEVSLLGGIIPKDFSELTRFASLVHQSKLAPKGFDTVEKVAIGLLTNMELSRPIITGLQDLAIINGRCGIYGDASLAMVTASGKMDEGYPKSTETGQPYTDDWTFTFTVKRIGRPEETGVWTWIDAKRAGFDAPKTRDGREDKWSPWTRFTKRMMQWKARNFVMRDNFGDILKGMKTVEDLHDFDSIPLSKQLDGSFSTSVETGLASDLADKIKGGVPVKETSKIVEPEKQNQQPGGQEPPPDTAETNGLKTEQAETPCPYCGKDINTNLLHELWKEPPGENFNCPHCMALVIVNNGQPECFSPIVADLVNKTDDDDTAKMETWRSEWIRLKGPGFSTYFYKNRGAFENAPPVLKTEAEEKWNKLYSGTPFPLTQPKEEKQADDAEGMEGGVVDAEFSVPAYTTEVVAQFKNITGMELIDFQAIEDVDDIVMGRFIEIYRDSVGTWPKEIQNIVVKKISEYPNWQAMFYKNVGVKKEEQPTTIQRQDDSEDWNGLKQCPKMQYVNIPKSRCKDCEDRPECSAWGEDRKF